MISPAEISNDLGRVHGDDVVERKATTSVSRGVAARTAEKEVAMAVARTAVMAKDFIVLIRLFPCPTLSRV